MEKPRIKSLGCNKILAIGTRGILIAHELNEDNTWNWTTAIDSQGINASNVTTGTLLADIIKAGTLSDINGNSWINMEDGTFSLANGQLTFDGSEFIVKIGSNKIDDLLNASFNVITNKEHIVVTLDTNSFPVEDVNHTITFRVLQGNTTSETPCIINKITPSNEIEGVNFAINNNSCTMSISKETRLFGIVEESFEVELEIKDYKIFKTITWSTISQGRDGQDGANGTPGISSYFHIKYAPNDNPTADEMTETVNTYIGTYVDEVKEDSNDPTKYTWSKLVGEDGKDGIVGKDGEDGVSSYLHIKYSDDMVSFTENNGETPGIYMGQYVDEIKEDSLVFNDYVWAKIKGEDGKDGTNGTPGASSYFHVKYAPNNNPTPEQMTDTPQQYIGTYVDGNIQDSDDPKKYTWIKIQGQDGTSISIDHTVSELPDTGIVGEYYYVTETGVLWRYEDTGWVELGKIQGEQGIPGKDGENGKTNYLHIRYSNDNGVTFTTNNGEDVGMYMGTYVDFTEEDSSNVNDYKWVRLKGEDGSSASYVKIISNNNLFVMSKGSNEYSPSNIVLTPEYTNCTFGKWQYSTDGGSDWTMVTNGLNGLTISSGILTINNNSPLFTEEVDNISFKVTASDGSSDIVTVARLKDGIDGDDGISATNVFLTNENHTFMATNDGKAIATSINFDVNGYVGIEEKPITFGTITGVPNGMNITKNGSNSTNAKLTISVTTDMTSLNGTITIPCICNGITFNKQFSYALSVPGKDGQDGINGTNGINGTSSYFHIKYAPVENPTANQMTETVNTYIGTYVDNNIEDSNNPSDYKWSKFVGQDGNNGNDGLPGKDGKDGTTYYLHVKYSNDGSTFTANSGETPGDYLGQLVDTNKEDSLIFNDYTWKKIKGEDGNDGISGTSSYFHIKYSPVENPTASQMTEVPSDYIGTYVDEIKEDSNDPSKYTWSRFKGQDGNDGEQGLPGEKGKDGTTYYLHIKYSDNGTTFTANNGETPGKYLGQLVDTTKEDSLVFSDYTWKKIEGDVGANASYVKIIANNQAFLKPSDSQTYSPSSIKLTPVFTNSTYSKWQYSTNNGSNWTDVTSGSNGLSISSGVLTISNTCNLYTNSIQSISFKVLSKDSTVYDVISILKLKDGSKGEAGITVLFDNESHIFNATIDGKAEATTLTINVLGYKGTMAKPCAIGTISGLPTGMTSAINNNNTTSASIKLTLTASMVTKNGTITIPVTCDGVTINKKFSYSLSIPGKDGYSHNYNLVKNSAFLYGKNSWNFATNVTLDTSKTFNGHPSAKTAQSGLTANYCRGCKNHNLPSNPTGFKKGETYTFSCYYYVENKTSIDNGITLEFKGKPLNSSEGTIAFVDISPSNIIENNWTRISKTITLTEDYYNCYIYAFVRRNGTAWFTDFKLEEGSKLTKWVACPEDTETYVDNLVADLQGQIDGKIQTYSQNNDPSTSWTTAEKANHEGDIWYNTSTKNTYRWNGTAWVLLQNAEAQSAKEIAQSKAQVFTGTPTTPYYKGDLWITSTEKGKGVVKTCITTRTSGNYTASDWVENLKYTDDTFANQLQEELNNLSIGGRNFLRNSAGNLNNTTHWSNFVLDTSEASTKGWNSFKLTRTNYASGNPRCQAVQDIPLNVLALKVGDYVTLSGWIYVSSQVTLSNGANNIALRNYASINDGDFEDICSFGYNNVPKNTWTYFKATSKATKNTVGGCRILVSIEQNGLIQVTRLKLEKGNRATDWTPAPEDTDTYIDNLVADLQGQIDGKIQTYSQSTDPSTSWTTAELKAKHSGDLWYNPNNSETKRWNGTTWVLLENAEAKQANQLAQTKAQVFTSQPKTPYYKGDLWITSLDGTGVVKTCIKDRTTGAYTASEWVESLKYTDDTLANKIQTDLNNLTIGGRNLFLKSDIDKYGLGNWGNNNGAGKGVVEGTFIDGTKTIKVTGNEGIQCNAVLKLKRNTNYVYSMMIKSSNSMTMADNRPLHMWLSTTETGSQHLEIVISKSGTIPANNWTKAWVAFKTPDAQDIYYMKPFVYGIGSNTLYICKVQVEEGNKATDWTPAPEDTDTYIDNLAYDLQGQIDGKIETYSQSTDPSTNWTTTQLKNKHLGDIWYNTSSKLTYRWSGSSWVKLSNKEAIDASNLANTKAQVFTSQPTVPYKKGDLWVTALDGTGIVKTCIKDRTSGSYTASEWVENLKYTDDTLAEQVQDELDNLSIGGRNLVRNSAFLYGTSFWSFHDSVTLDNTKLFNGHPSCKSSPSGLTANGWKGCKNYYLPLVTTDFKKGETYTLSCYYYVEDKTSIDKGITLEFKGKALNSTSESVIGNLGISPSNIIENNWTRISKTITLAQDYSVCCIYAFVDRNGTAWFTDFKLEKGNRASDWCPAVEEYKGSSIHIQPSTNIFKYSGSAYSPNTITLTPILTNSTYSKWQYSTNGGSSWTNVTSGSNGLTISNGVLTIANTCNLYTSSVTSVAFKVIATGEEEISDVITIPRLKDGDKGADSVNIFLGNENHTFVASSDGKAVATSVSTSVLGYAGTTAKSCTVGTISGLPTGMTATINKNNSTSTSITFAVTTSLTTKNGTVTIPVTCNGVTINKIFSYSLAVAGANGSSSKLIKINAPTNVFKSTDGGITFKPSSISFTFTTQNVNFSKWQYSTNGGSSWTNVSTSISGITVNGSTLAITSSCSLFTESVTAITIKCLSNTSTVYDTLTVYKLYDRVDINEAFEEMELTVTQSNTKWEACFKNSNANNLFLNSDARTGTTDEWVSNGGGLSIGKAGAFPFYGENEFKTSFSNGGGARYAHDIRLEPNTDYVYEGYIYTDTSLSGTDVSPLHFWIWKGTTPTSTRLCTVVDYRQTLTVGRFVKCYCHFKTNNVNEALYGRFFVYHSGTSRNIAFKRMSLKKGVIETEWTQHPNEVKSSVVSIDETGVNVKHSEIKTTTNMNSQGFSIMDAESGDVLAWLSSKEQWTELKVDKVFANNIENVYTGDSYLYVDHSKTVAGNGTSSKPFNSFAQLSAYLQATPVINYDLYITVKNPGFNINEMLILNNLKGSGIIKITLEGQLVISNQGGSSCCMEFHQIDKLVWIVGSREFGSKTTGAVLRDGGDGNGYGIWATDVKRIEVDAITIACKNTGLLAERCHAYTWHCDFGKCNIAVELRYQSLYYTSDDVGSCSKFCILRSGSFAYWGAGTTRPQGSVDKANGVYYDGGVSLTATASPRYPSSNPTPPSTSGQIFTKTYNCTSKQTYQYAWSNWSTDGSCKQGAWSHGLRGGHLFFNMSTIRSEMTGTIQDGNTITLTRANSGGISGDANVYINGSTCSSASGTPSYSNQTHLGTLKWGETKTFTLPKAIVQSLINGTCNSLAVYVNSTASNNYINITSASITLKTKK